LDENKIGGVSASADESKKMELSVHVRVSGGLLAVRCQHGREHPIQIFKVKASPHPLALLKAPEIIQTYSLS
jgi:hypothetical protein